MDNNEYIKLPRKEGDFMELLGQDVDSCYVSHERVYLRVPTGKKNGNFPFYDTIMLTMDDLLRIINLSHLFCKKARKHYHIVEVNGIYPDI
jgi:hypothetical protein